MKILHTSDWHLGRLLEGASRLPEQAMFLEELDTIVEEEKVDLILVAGDIYDSGNPSAQAEKLFYKSIVRLSRDGKIPIVIIAGNHDSPERLTAASPLAYEQGIIMLGTPKSVAQVGNYEHYAITEAGEGYFTIELKGEKAVILAMPYPSEKRLGEILGDIGNEEEFSGNYSERIGSLFQKLEEKYTDDSIHLAIGHFFVAGGIESGSERPIQLGGSLAVSPFDLPQKAQYIALGHLHRPQTVGRTDKRAYYSGSPIQYNKEEILYAKGVNIVEIYPGKDAVVKKRLLRNYKPIECWEASCVEDALVLCTERAEENCWVYFSIHTQRALEQWELKKMKMTKKDIVEIIPLYEEGENIAAREMIAEKSVSDQFRDFYLKAKGVSPSEEAVDLFLSLLEEEEGHEADYA